MLCGNLGAWPNPPFRESNARAATAIGVPAIHLVMPSGLTTGTPVIQHGRHGEADYGGVALVAKSFEGPGHASQAMNGPIGRPRRPVRRERDG